MKNGLLIWNVVLTLIAGYLLITHFGAKKAEKTASNSTSPTGIPSAPGSFRIAYFDQDSVEGNYNMIKDVIAEIEKKEVDYNNKLAGLDATYRRKEMEYQQKGTMTQVEIDKARQDLSQLRSRLNSDRQVLDLDYQSYVTTRNISVKKSIEDFLSKFNQSKNYSYIISAEQGGIFYYKDSAYNITGDLIKGLNEEYSQKKKELEKGKQ